MCKDILNAAVWKNGWNKILVDGLKRSFILRTPTELKPGAPLVMIWHGYGVVPNRLSLIQNLTILLTVMALF